MDITSIFTVFIGILLIFLYKMSKYFSHPGQIIPLFKLMLAQTKLKVRQDTSPEWKWCFEMLRKTSRSFYFVIMGLTPDFIRPVAVFYLIARALDTIEDDMKVPSKKKEKPLCEFYTQLGNEDYSLAGFGANPTEVELLEEYGKLAKCYNSLNPAQKSVITAAIKEMGYGMNQFLDEEVISVAQYDKYCYYVAGLVGTNSIELTILSGVCAPFGITDETRRTLCISAGLFLQKVNIIRDIREDLLQIPRPRIFWPKEVWCQYAAKLDDFLVPSNKQAAVNCCNELIINAIPHVFDGLTLYPNVSDLSCQKALGVAFTMGVATLGLCYNNEKVFTAVVKMKKGEAAWICDNCTDLLSVISLVRYYLCKLKVKLQDNKEKHGVILVDKCVQKCDELLRAA